MVINILALSLSLSVPKIYPAHIHSCWHTWTWGLPGVAADGIGRVGCYWKQRIVEHLSSGTAGAAAIRI
uniref:Putative secreted protein n=1 Tax=Anopheles marajoara TaxID=58244 RepID=A0A2M4CES7_9DIPT